MEVNSGFGQLWQLLDAKSSHEQMRNLMMKNNGGVGLRRPLILFSYINVVSNSTKQKRPAEGVFVL
jgi:hypothetical protein